MESHVLQAVGALAIGLSAAFGAGVGIMVIRIAGAYARLAEGER